MNFASQQEYERYYSAEQRQRRTEEAKLITEIAVSEALALFNMGDREAASQRLFDAGIQDDGIACYLDTWGSDASINTKQKPKLPGMGF